VQFHGLVRGRPRDSVARLNPQPKHSTVGTGTNLIREQALTPSSTPRPLALPWRPTIPLACRLPPIRWELELSAHTFGDLGRKATSSKKAPFVGVIRISDLPWSAIARLDSTQSGCWPAMERQ